MDYVCLCVYCGQKSKWIKLVFGMFYHFVPWALDLPTERETSPADEVTDLENFSWLAYLQF